jgi:hypothetical protein
MEKTWFLVPWPPRSILKGKGTKSPKNTKSFGEDLRNTLGNKMESKSVWICGGFGLDRRGEGLGGGQGGRGERRDEGIYL